VNTGRRLTATGADGAANASAPRAQLQALGLRIVAEPLMRKGLYYAG
jgi:hypothetical protein